MGFYKATMDLQVVNWQEAEVIIQANSMEKAIQKAKELDFLDIALKEAYDTEVLDYDKCEGIVLEKII